MTSALGVVLICMGLVFFFGTVIGLLRFPDFYTRIHAAGKGDTLSSALILLGLILHRLNDFHHFDLTTVITCFKILLICIFIYIGSPTASHAIMDAGEKYGIKPWTRGGTSQ